MRIALARWRAETDKQGFTAFTPDIDLGEVDAWGAIDLRGSGKDYQQSADGLCLVVAPNLDTAIPGALIDLGDDHQTRLGTTVGRALANRLGLNLVEATPGRIAAELLTLHASADDDSKPNPLVGERRFPRSKTDQRRRARVWCAGVLLYDELGAHVDEEMAYYAETFPTAGALTSSQDLPWDSSSDPFTVASGGAYALPGSAGDAYQRMATAHSSADHFAEIVAQLGDDSLLTWVGPIIRAETSNATTGSYGAQIRAREFDLFAYSSRFSGAFIGFGSTSLSLDTDFTARLEGDGSTIRLYINESLAGSTTNSSYSGVHAGISAGDSTTPDNTRIYSFATALNGEEPGGGDDAIALTDRGQKNTTAGTSTAATVTSDAFTPAEGAVVAVIVGGYLGNTALSFGATDTFGDTGGGTWQEVTAAATGAGYTGRSSIFWRRIGTNPSSGTVTITRTPSGSVDQWMTATFVEVEGTEGARLGVRQSKTGTNASSSLALTFDDQVGGDSLVLTGVTSLADTSITTPAGFTLLDHVVGASSSAASAHGTDSPTWTGLGSFINAGVAVEIAEAKSWCLVTLHGAGNNTSVYGGPAPHPSGALYDTRPVQGPVVLGSGSYDWSPDWFGSVTFPNWSTIEALLESAAEGYERVAVAGFSAGGAVAIEMLRRGFDFDGRLVGVILDDPAGPVDATAYDNPNNIPVALYLTSPDGGSTWNQDVAMEALGVFDHLEKLVALAGGPPTLNPHSTSHAPMMVGQSDYAESADEDWWQPAAAPAVGIVRTARGTAGDSLPLVSQAFTPNEGDVVVAICVGFDAPAADEPNHRWTPTDTFGDSGGGSWQSISVDSTNDADFWQRTTIFYRVIGTGASSGTISCNRSTGWFSFNSAQFHQLSGVDTSAPVRQSNTNAVSNQAVSSISVSLPSAPLADSLVITTVHTLFGAADPTNPSGYVTVGSVLGDTLVCEVAEAEGASASQSVTWGVSSDACAGTIIVEFAAAGDDEPGEPEPVDVNIAPAEVTITARPVTVSGGEPIPGTVDYVIGLHGEGGGPNPIGGFGSGGNYPVSTGGDVPFLTVTTQGPVAMGGGGYGWAEHPTGIPGDEVYDWPTIKAILDAAVPPDARRVSLHGFSAGGAVAAIAIAKGWRPPYGEFVGVVLDDPAYVGDANIDSLANNSGVKVALWATNDGTNWIIDWYYGRPLLGDYETAFGVERQQNPYWSSHAPMTRSWDDQGPYAPPELLSAEWWDVDEPEPVVVGLSPAVVEVEARPVAVTPGASAVGISPAFVEVEVRPVAVTPGEAAVGLSPASTEVEARPVSLTTGAATVLLTPAVVEVEAYALAVVPGGVAVPLVPAAVEVQAVPVAVVGGPSVVALAAAVVEVEARPLTVTPGEAAVGLSPAVVEVEAQPVEAVPGGVVVSLTAAVVELEAVPVGIEGVAQVNLARATFTFSASALAVTPGEAAVGLSPASTEVEARPVEAVPGGVAAALTAAVVELEALPLSIDGGPSVVALTPAVVEVAAVPLAIAGGPAVVALAPAAVEVEAVPLAMTPGPVSVDLGPAVLSIAARQLEVTPGAVAVALSAAVLSVVARALNAHASIPTDLHEPVSTVRPPQFVVTILPDPHVTNQRKARP